MIIMKLVFIGVARYFSGEGRYVYVLTLGPVDIIIWGFETVRMFPGDL